eukprot:13644756-Ditylum_brightwellii.AAC.1
MEMIGKASGIHFRSNDLAAFAMQGINSIELGVDGNTGSGAQGTQYSTLHCSEKHLITREVSSGDNTASENARKSSSEESYPRAKQKENHLQTRSEQIHLSECTDSEITSSDASLPPWSRNSSKRALEELKQASERSSLPDITKLDPVNESQTGQTSQKMNKSIFPSLGIKNSTIDTNEPQKCANVQPSKSKNNNTICDSADT